MNIPLGYEVGTGKRVEIPLNHMVVLGQTQLSGKTTTLEALVARSGCRAVAFITKPGEKSFRQQNAIPAFFSESTAEEYWKHVVAILEYRGETHLGWKERGMVIKLCQDYSKATSRIGMPDKKGKSKRESVKYEWDTPSTLAELLENIETYLPFARQADESICIQLREFLRPAIREIEQQDFSNTLKLAKGINVMNITDLSDGLKSLVIRSVIEHVHKKMQRTIVIVPEAWKFIPEGRTTPVKLALEGLIREGAGLQNFVWMDSQDLRGVDKKLLRSVIVWLFGVQRQRNELLMTLDSMPDYPKPTATEIMQLGKGQFFVSHGTTLVRTYVQPAGMENEHAKAIARGEEEPESWKGISAALDRISQDDDELRESPLPACGDGSSVSDGLHEMPVQSIQETSEETMWKEKYDELKKEYDSLVDSHDSMVARVKVLEAKLERGTYAITKDSPVGEVAVAGERAAEHIPGRGNGSGTDSAASAFLAPSDLNFLLAQFRELAQRDPVVLRILQERPELQIKREIKTILANASTLKGALGILISEKFFDSPRPFDDIRREFIRRGFIAVKTPSRQIEGAIDSIVEFGFLTKEETGLRAVPGMQINITEVKA